jgi:carboxylesterase type B
MRSKSADFFLNTMLTKPAPLGVSGSGPIPDGNVVPVNPIAAIRAGQYAKVPVLVGTRATKAGCSRRFSRSLAARAAHDC